VRRLKTESAREDYILPLIPRLLDVADTDRRTIIVCPMPSIALENNNCIVAVTNKKIMWRIYRPEK